MHKIITRVVAEMLNQIAAEKEPTISAYHASVLRTECPNPEAVPTTPTVAFIRRRPHLEAKPTA